MPRVFDKLRERYVPVVHKLQRKRFTMDLTRVAACLWRAAPAQTRDQFESRRLIARPEPQAQSGRGSSPPTSCFLSACKPIGKPVLYAVNCNRHLHGDFWRQRAESPLHLLAWVSQTRGHKHGLSLNILDSVVKDGERPGRVDLHLWQSLHGIQERAYIHRRHADGKGVRPHLRDKPVRNC